MPDFRLIVNVNGSGVAEVPTRVWTDPPSGARPGRLNPEPTRQPLYFSVAVFSTVRLSAVVDGVLEPLDAALGGRLFDTTLIEVPLLPGPEILHPSGRTSFATFDPNVAGHYAVRFAREGGGGVIVHVDAR